MCIYKSFKKISRSTQRKMASSEASRVAFSRSVLASFLSMPNPGRLHFRLLRLHVHLWLFSSPQLRLSPTHSMP